MTTTVAFALTDVLTFYVYMVGFAVVLSTVFVLLWHYHDVS